MTEEPTATNRGAGDAVAIYKDGTYLDRNETWHVENSPWKAKHIENILRNNSVNPGRFCEVGCGAGEILKQLSPRFPNSSFVGYELSPQAFDLCKTRESTKVKFLLKNILAEDVFYDCLLCIDVFEHVEDYMGFLRALKTKANFKVFHIPIDLSVSAILRSSMMLMRRTVGHLHYFNRETALATLSDCGYEVIDSFYTPFSLDFPTDSLRGKFGQFRYRLLFGFSQHLAVKLYGGSSLLVLAR
jgi:hypothetical protein